MLQLYPIPIIKCKHHNPQIESREVIDTTIKIEENISGVAFKNPGIINARVLMRGM